MSDAVGVIGAKPLWIQRETVNITKGYRSGSTRIYLASTTDVGKLFRLLQREHGRCVGSVYIDRKDGTTRRIGWVFRKKVSSERFSETFLSESWITIFDRIEPNRYNYHDLGANHG